MLNSKLKANLISLSLLYLILLLTSCASASLEILESDLEKTYTQDGKNIGGVVVYNPYGPQRMVEIRRNKAVSRMRKVCEQKDYKIKNEQRYKPSQRVEKYQDQPDILGGRTAMFIDFKCQ